LWIACLATFLARRRKLLDDPRIAPFVRIVTLLVVGLPAVDANALAAEDGVSTLLVPRRTVFLPFLSSCGLTADIAYAISQSADHDRASAYFTSDDDSGPGDAFTLDGLTLTHRYRCRIPAPSPCTPLQPPLPRCTSFLMRYPAIPTTAS